MEGQGHSQRAISLDALNEDVLSLIFAHATEENAGGAISTYRAMCNTSIVNSSLHRLLRPLKSVHAKDAALALISRRCREPESGGPEEASGDLAGLLNLSHRRLGTFECRLLALALANGQLSTVSSIWLQDNAISAQGLRWLARGLRALPRVRRGPLSVALGGNPFVRELRDPSVALALNKLVAEATAQRIQVRLFS